MDPQLMKPDNVACSRKSNRLASLDATRGFTVLLMMFVHFKIGNPVKYGLHEVPQPLFTFMVGSSVEFAMPRALERDHSFLSYKTVITLLLRGLKIYTVGTEIQNGMLFDAIDPLKILVLSGLFLVKDKRKIGIIMVLAHLRFYLFPMGFRGNFVIRRLGIVYFLTAFLRLLTLKMGASPFPMWIVAFLGLFIPYYLVVYGYQLCSQGISAKSCKKTMQSVLPLFPQLPQSPFFKHVLYTIPALFHSILGLQVSIIVRSSALTKKRKSAILLALILIANFAFHLFRDWLADPLRLSPNFTEWNVPVELYHACYDLTCFFVFYVVLDVVNLRWRGWPLTCLGRNAMLVFVAHHIINVYLKQLKTTVPVVSQNWTRVNLVHIVFWILCSAILDYRGQYLSF